MNDEQLNAYLRLALLEIFPQETELYFHRNAGAVLIGCAWRMQNDPARPKKHSVPIHIEIARRPLDWLKAADADAQVWFTSRLLTVIRLRMREYLPESELPPGVAPQPFDIHVDEIDLAAVL